MRILTLSDTHGKFGSYLPGVGGFPGLKDNIDVILHAGDITNLGHMRPWEVKQSIDWMSNLRRIAPVYWIPGNHDIGFKGDEYDSIPGVHCLLNKKTILPNDVSIWGVSMSCCYDKPRLADNWDYSTARKEIEEMAYDFEPVDIVVSHSPPKYMRDECPAITHVGKSNIGSECLSSYISANHPLLVICGHVHESAGKMSSNNTLVVNSACTWNVISYPSLRMK